jgi:hypothetical protein
MVIEISPGANETPEQRLDLRLHRGNSAEDRVRKPFWVFKRLTAHGQKISTFRNSFVELPCQAE